MSPRSPSSRPRVLDRRTLARTRLFHVEGLGLEFANGVRVDYERLASSSQGAVLVVAVEPDRTVYLVREYCAGVERYELGLPKGRLEPGEALLEAANRELMEEVGLGARRLEHLTSFTLAPGYFSHVTHVVLARGLYPRRLPGDEPEPLEVVPWSLDRLPELLAREDCTEARSIAALYWVRELLDREESRP
ncbi:MAG: ADP compounds hydrolase NudE [Gammaproteobacteria bacterium]|nr:MAG: ADP compounds hydrolase NudE [Gammaproteobacteria bacterium]